MGAEMSSIKSTQKSYPWTVWIFFKWNRKTLTDDKAGDPGTAGNKALRGVRGKEPLSERTKE
jgi:hypothetical protein